MPLSYAELEQFYESLVSRARSRGITCGITSGMACVAFGVAQATKDWPFATALGVKLLEAGDPRGWLHLFNYDVLVQTARKLCPPAAIVALRPVLALLGEGDERLELALKGEIEFWNRLDQLRMKVYERAVRPYMVAVKGDPRSSDPALAVQHHARLEYAGQLLPATPLRQYGVERLIDEAQAQAARFLPPGALRWLPDAEKCFNLLAT